MRGGAPVDEPVDRADEQGAADPVTQRYRCEVEHEMTQAYRRKAPSQIGPEALRRSSLDQEAEGNEVHVRDAVLKTGGNKGADRQQMASILSPTLRAPSASHTARQTSTLHSMPRKNAWITGSPLLDSPCTGL